MNSSSADIHLLSRDYLVNGGIEMEQNNVRPEYLAIQMLRKESGVAVQLRWEFRSLSTKSKEERQEILKDIAADILMRFGELTPPPSISTDTDTSSIKVVISASAEMAAALSAQLGIIFLAPEEAPAGFLGFIGMSLIKTSAIMEVVEKGASGNV